VHCCGSRVGNGWLVLRDGQAAPAGPAGQSGFAPRVRCCGSRVGNGWLVLRDGQAAPAGPAGRSGCASRVHCCGSRVGNGWLVLRDGQAELAGPAGRSGCTSRVHCCGGRGRRPRHDKPARQSAPGCCWLALGAVRLRRVPAGRCWYLTSAASLMMLVSRGAALAHVARE
jgi:hypothetical protein